MWKIAAFTASPFVARANCVRSKIIIFLGCGFATCTAFEYQKPVYFHPVWCKFFAIELFILYSERSLSIWHHWRLSHVNGCFQSCSPRDLWAVHHVSGYTIIFVAINKWFFRLTSVYFTQFSLNTHFWLVFFRNMIMTFIIIVTKIHLWSDFAHDFRPDKHHEPHQQVK